MKSPASDSLVAGASSVRAPSLIAISPFSGTSSELGLAGRSQTCLIYSWWKGDEESVLLGNIHQKVLIYSQWGWGE